MTRRWIGWWIISVSALHTLFGLVAFGPDLVGIALTGFWDSIGEDLRANAVAWFMLSGFFMAAFGFAVDALERSVPRRELRSAGTALMITAIVGIVLMPVSGLWLLLPPGIAMLLGHRSTRERGAA